MTSTTPSILNGSVAAADLVLAGQAVAGLMPATEALTPGSPAPADALAVDAWPAAAVADLTRTTGTVGVLVARELVDALAQAPDGGLDLADALQPVLDAAASALGVTAGPGRTLTGAALTAALTGDCTVLPLLAGEQTAAVLFVTGVADTRVELPATTTTAPTAATGSAPVRGVELLHGVAMEVTVELGRTRLSVRELLALSPGDVLELDRAAGSPADLLVNGRLIARGEVVVVDEDFALRVTEIVSTGGGS
ncbi:MAG: flagellar motor switch protein FliN [Nocardioidaceae bacterium]